MLVCKILWFNYISSTKMTKINNATKISAHTVAICTNLNFYVYILVFQWLRLTSIELQGQEAPCMPPAYATTSMLFTGANTVKTASSSLKSYHLLEVMPFESINQRHSW